MCRHFSPPKCSQPHGRRHQLAPVLHGHRGHTRVLRRASSVHSAPLHLFLTRRRHHLGPFLCPFKHAREFKFTGSHFTGPLPEFVSTCYPHLWVFDLGVRAYLTFDRLSHNDLQPTTSCQAPSPRGLQTVRRVAPAEGVAHMFVADAHTLLRSGAWPPQLRRAAAVQGGAQPAEWRAMICTGEGERRGTEGGRDPRSHEQGRSPLCLGRCPTCACCGCRTTT